MTTFEASLLSDMQDGICKAGGVFYNTGLAEEMQKPYMI